MDVLKEAWEGPMPQQQCSELSYVMKMRDKLDQFQEIANGNLAQAQQRQEQIYDKAFRRRRPPEKSSLPCKSSERVDRPTRAVYNLVGTHSG